MPKAKLKTTTKDAVSEMQQLQSDLIRGLGQLQLKIDENRPLQEARRRVLEDEMIPTLRELKSINDVVLEALAAAHTTGPKNSGGGGAGGSSRSGAGEPPADGGEEASAAVAADDARRGMAAAAAVVMVAAEQSNLQAVAIEAVSTTVVPSSTLQASALSLAVAETPHKHDGASQITPAIDGFLIETKNVEEGSITIEQPAATEVSTILSPTGVEEEGPFEKIFVDLQQLRALTETQPTPDVVRSLTHAIFGSVLVQLNRPIDGCKFRRKPRPRDGPDLEPKEQGKKAMARRTTQVPDEGKPDLMVCIWSEEETRQKIMVAVVKVLTDDEAASKVGGTCRRGSSLQPKEESMEMAMTMVRDATRDEAGDSSSSSITRSGPMGAKIGNAARIDEVLWNTEERMSPTQGKLVGGQLLGEIEGQQVTTCFHYITPWDLVTYGKLGRNRGAEKWCGQVMDITRKDNGKELVGESNSTEGARMLSWRNDWLWFEGERVLSSEYAGRCMCHRERLRFDQAARDYNNGFFLGGTGCDLGSHALIQVATWKERKGCNLQSLMGMLMRFGVTIMGLTSSCGNNVVPGYKLGWDGSNRAINLAATMKDFKFEGAPCVGGVRVPSPNGFYHDAALEVLPLVRDANPVPIGVIPSPKYLKELDERCLIFRTTEHQTEFFAKKNMEAYKDEYPAVELELEEGITSNKVESCGCLYVHINFKVKDVDGSVHLFFAEATFDYQPVVLSHCILERDITGGYEHHQKGCGGCYPDADVPIYHPRGDYLHGY
ncbi:unnamed protein product [Linum trigynum]|uniref:DUF3615 domain-containing protein n=1 Tax=Linum trigynum TaxID=586398 RepID=A0AAV2G7Y4_9ROSI